MPETYEREPSIAAASESGIEVPRAIFTCGSGVAVDRELADLVKGELSEQKKTDRS